MDNNDPSKNPPKTEVRTLENDIAELEKNQSGELGTKLSEDKEMQKLFKGFEKGTGIKNAPIKPLEEEFSHIRGIMDTNPVVEPTFKNPDNTFLSESAEPENTQEAAAETLEVPLTKKPAISPIETYTGDVEDAVRTQHTSKASIALAESTRKNKRASSESGEESDRSHAIKMLIMILVGLVLLISGGIALYYFLIVYKTNTLVPIVAPVDQIIGSDTNMTLSLSGIDRDTFIKNLATALQDTNPSGTLGHITLTTTTGASTTPAEPSDLLSLLQAKAPDSLVRSLDPGFFFGAYSEGEATSKPFLIFKTAAFSTTFAGMLQWEQTMIQDLQGIFLMPQDQLVAPFFDTTVSGDTYSFQDGLIDNKNVRLAQDPSGKIVLLYTFIDNNTLVITSDVATLRALEAEISKAQVVR